MKRPHRMLQLQKLARDLALTRLEILAALQATTTSSLAIVGGGAGGRGSVLRLKENLRSSFSRDMLSASHDPRLADVVIWARDRRNGSCGVGSDGAKSGVGDSAAEEGDHSSLKLLFAHKTLLQHVDFFSCNFSGRFGISTPPSDVSIAAAAAFNDARPSKELQAVDLPVFVDMTSFLDDGLSWASLQRVVRFCYGGNGDGILESLAREDPSALTELLAAAERIGVEPLVKLCEHALVGVLDTPALGVSVSGGGKDEQIIAIANTKRLQGFARQFNLRKLEIHCIEVLGTS